MAILRRPGAVVKRTLPSDADLPEERRGVVNVRIPSEADYRNLLKLDVMARSGQLNGFEMLRQKLGISIDSLENVFYEDGVTQIVLEKDKDGKLTPPCMAQLMPIADELMSLCDGVARITERDAKN